MFKKLFTNSITNIGVQILNIVIVFIMTPIIVQSLGNYDYGIWEILGSIIGYMGLLQLGLPPAVVRYVARYNALNDKEKLNQLLSSVFFIVSAIGLVCAFFLSGWALMYPDAIAKEGLSSDKYSIFLFIIAINVFLMFPQLFFQSFHEGFQRYKLTRMISAIKMIICNTVVYYMLKNGYGLITFALISTIGLFFQLFFLWIFLFLPKYGGFVLKRKFITFKMIKELYAFGLKSFLLGIAGRVAFQTDSIVIGIFLNPVIVAFYIIPINFLNKIKTIIMSITLVFMPYFSELYARKDDSDLLKQYLLYSRYVIGIAIVMFLGAFFLGLNFIKLWIGPEYSEEGKYIFYIIGTAFFLPFLNPFQGRALTSMGQHGILARFKIIEALMNILLSIMLISYWGKEGVAIGTLIPAIIMEPVIFYHVAKRIKFNLNNYFKHVIVPQFIPAIITACLYHILLSLIEMNSYANIFTTATFCSAFYFIPFFIFTVSKKERHIIIKRLKSKI